MIRKAYSLFEYGHVDVFICMECGHMRAMKKNLCRKKDFTVPHCSCTGELIKMGMIGSMPKSTYLSRKRQAQENWMRFRFNHRMMGKFKKKRFDSAAIRRAYDLGMA